jgi:hypothetical protein
VPQTGRLTNLKQLTVDTTWWTRYRSATANPDLGGMFENAVPDLAKGQQPAIPLTNADLLLNPDGSIPNHLQAIANTAGFHFQTWPDKAGNAPATTDGALTFPNLVGPVTFDPHTGAKGQGVADEFQSNLIMPEPTVFLDPKFGPVAIIRPTSTQQGGAVASTVSFVNDDLFLDPGTGKNTDIVEVLMDLAQAADAAQRKM